MESRVVALLVARLAAGAPPASARELLSLLALPKTEKSRLNQLLYKTAVAPAHPNPLGLPRQYRLVRTETTPPLWSAAPRDASDIPPSPREPAPPAPEPAQPPPAIRVAPLEHVFLDCDSIIGPARDHVQCVVLGMAILECVAANPGRAVALRTRNPGTHAVLRSVLKTNEYARTLDLSLAPLATQ